MEILKITYLDFNDVLTPSSTGTSYSSNSNAAVDGSGNNLVWSSYVGDNWEVFYYDGTQTIQVTDNSIDDLYPKISGDTLVWSTSGTTSDIFKFEPDPNPDTFEDDFDPNIDNIQWSSVGNSSVNSNFGGSGNSLFFTGGSYRDSSRYITTTGVNVANGGEIYFELIFGTSSNGGENADAGEDVVLEYSTDNGINWVGISLYDTEVYTNWTGISESIPVGAQTDDTQFRWLQVGHSGSSFDNWGLDNILIEAF